MGCVVAVVSPQGGAAKSVAVMVLAETLAAQKRKSVLVIDCDPETRSSMLLASTPRWAQVEVRQHTVLHLLEQALAYQRMPDIDSFLIAGCSNVAGAEAVALVAGHPGLALFDWRTGKDEESVRQFRRVLKHFVALIRDHFDVILVVCPAALGALTEAWLAIADAFFTPIRPDAMAASNIAVLRAVEREAVANRLAFPEDLGVLIALKDETLTSHIIGHRRLDDDLANRCFPLAMPRHAALEQPAECLDDRMLFKRKYPGPLAEIAIQTAGTLLARLP